MKQKKGFELHDVCGEQVIVAQGIEHLDFSKLIHLNETAAFLWEAVKGIDFDAEMMANKLIEAEYDVDKATALNDCAMLIEEWKKMGLVE